MNIESVCRDRYVPQIMALPDTIFGICLPQDSEFYRGGMLKILWCLSGEVTCGHSMMTKGQGKLKCCRRTSILVVRLPLALARPSKNGLDVVCCNGFDQTDLKCKRIQANSIQVEFTEVQLWLHLCLRCTSLYRGGCGPCDGNSSR